MTGCSRSAGVLVALSLVGFGVGCGVDKPPSEHARLRQAVVQGPECRACHQRHSAHQTSAKQDITWCQSCHGANLLGGDTSTSCENCHAGWQTNCTFCHGRVGTDGGAPPRDTRGGTSTALTSVGAHTSHVTAPHGLSLPISCDACHVVPAGALSPGHMNGDAGVVFRVPISSGWNRTTGTCGVQCHGEFDGGARANRPVWTSVGTGQANCGTCHALPPPPPHPNATSSQCIMCHATMQADGGIDRALHINGRVDVTCGGCHDLPPQTGAHTVHAALAERLYGGLGTAESLPSPGGYAFGCGHCHPLDWARHNNGGLAEVELYNPAAPAGSLKRRSPTASYVAGSTTYTDSKGVAFTLGTCGNVYCHSGPTYSAPDVPAPGVDFPFTGWPIVYPAYVVTEGRDFPQVGWGSASPGCGGCHGYPIRTFYPQVKAMAGQTHSWIDSWGYENGHAYNMSYDPVPCERCHRATVNVIGSWSRDGNGVATFAPIPIAGFGKHVNGTSDVVFDPTPFRMSSEMNLANATYNPATRTCTNVACHLLQTEVRSGAPYRWENSYECNTCHQY